MKQRLFTLAPYPFAPLLTAVACGIVLQQQLTPVNGIAWLSACLLTTSITITLHLRNTLHRKAAFARLTAMLTSFLLLGATLACYRDVRRNPDWYGHSLDQVSFLAAHIDEPPIEKLGTFLLPVTVTAICKQDQWERASGTLKIYVYKKGFPADIGAGQSILIPNELTAITPSGNPFSFDAAAYAHHNGLYHQCFLSSSQVLALPGPKEKPGAIAMIKQSIRVSIGRNVKDSVTAGLIDAMLINDRTSLDPELQDAYSSTGIIHILAISGMHIILLAGILLLLLGKIPVRRIRQSRHVIAVIVIWIYIAVTGFPPSANRAAVTFTLATVGLLLNRDASPVNIWAASGFLLICYNPCWIYDVGFQLSFLAVLSLLLFNKTVTAWWQPRPYVLRKLWEGIAISISVQILVFPLVIYYFNQFPLMVFLANIPAGIYSTVLMVGSMLICTVAAFGIPCAWLGQLLSASTHAFNALIVLLSHYAPDSLKTLHIDATDYWLMMAVIIAGCVYYYYKSAKALIATLCAAITLTVSFAFKEAGVLRQERIVVYNVSKESQVDVFKGDSAYHLYPVTPGQYKYTLKPTRLGFGAIAETVSGMDCWYIKRRRILLLKEELSFGSGNFPVDVLIVSGRCRFDPENWMHVFHPATIVLDSSVPRWKAKQWKKRLAAWHIAVYYSGDKAWCYPSL